MNQTRSVMRVESDLYAIYMEPLIEEMSRMLCASSVVLSTVEVEVEMWMRAMVPELYLECHMSS